MGATILYYSGAFIAETIPKGPLLLVAALGLMCFSLLLYSAGTVAVPKRGFILYILIFVLYCAASMKWAQKPELSIPKVNGLIFIMLAMIIIHLCFYKQVSVDDLLKAIMYGGYIVVLYAFARYGVSGVFRLLANDSRITNEVFNANTLGMVAAYSIIINVFYFIYDRIRIRDLMIVPAIALLVASQSRKAFILVAMGIVGIYMLKNLKKKKFGWSVLKIFVGLVVIAVLFVAVSKIPVMRPVVRRMLEIVEMLAGKGVRGKNSAWIRFAYNDLGIKLFKEHPIFGIGIGNANIYTQMYYNHDHYLHNNYIELLACGGIVGFLLYYSIWIYLLLTFIRCRKQRSREYDICLILMLIHLVLDYGAVSYYSKETYVFLMLFWMEAQILLKERAARRSSYLSGECRPLYS